MATFSEAVQGWTDTINDWYSLGAVQEEVEEAFKLLEEWRTSQDDPGDDPYIETFFKDHNDGWKTGLDTVDREHLAGFVEKIRSQPEPKTMEQHVEDATNVIESRLNKLYDLGLSNEELKALLRRIILDIDRGFVGEPC